MSTHAIRPGVETEPDLDYSAASFKSIPTISGTSDTTPVETDLRAYFAVVYGPSVGRAHMSVGSGSHLKANGKYNFTDFVSSSFPWPAEADALVRTIIQEYERGQNDVYVCPNLMVGRKRAKGAAAARWTVHAEVDSELDVDKVKKLGGFALSSGSPGHSHVYIPLTDSVSAIWHEALCRGLKEFVGATDSKISDNDLLRPPGSLNHKGPVFGRGPATVAGFLIRPDGSGQDPHELAAALGISLPTSSTSGKRITPKKQVTPTPTIDLDNLPLEVQDALDDKTDDRSNDTMRIVGACLDAGLSLVNTRSVVASREDLAGRLDDRDDDDVQRSWLKVVDSRQERKQVTPRFPTEPATAGALRTTLPRIQPAGTAGSAEVTTVRPAFTRLNLAALLSPDRPPREWVVRRLIPAGASVSIVAAAGAGKSLLVLALSIAIARGDSDFAGYPISRRRRVLLVDMENTEDDLADRFTSLGVRAGDADELSDLILIHLPLLDGLDTVKGAQQLRENLDAHQVKSGDVVVLDSLQRVMEGPENDSDTLRAFYQLSGIMLKQRGVTVIRTDNTGKDSARGARGSSGKRDDVDIELILTRDPQDPDLMTLTPGKSRLPDINAVHLTRVIDDLTGRLRYVGASDPAAERVADVIAALEEIGLPPNTGETKALEALENAKFHFVRKDLRAALKQRKSAST